MIRAALVRVVSIADDPSDDDDTRRRNRVGVIAGLLTLVAPLALPIQAPRHPGNPSCSRSGCPR